MISSVTSGSTGVDPTLLAAFRSARAATSETRSGSDTDRARGPHGGPQGPPPGPPPEAIDSAAEALGMSTDDVRSALEQGSTLADLAEQQGVSRDDLLAAVTEGLTTGATRHGRSLSSEQLADMAEHIVNGVPPVPPPRTEEDSTLSALRELDTATTTSDVARCGDAFRSWSAQALALLGTSTGTLADTAV